MYQDRIDPILEAPVPGMGMTHEVGARPWQKPAQYNDIDRVAEFYIAQMQTDTFTDQVLSLLETDMPVTMIANSMNTVNVMEGVHSIDIGMLTMPIIMEMIMLIAETEGVDYTTGIDREFKTDVEDTDLLVAADKAEKQGVEISDEELAQSDEDMLQQEEEEDIAPTGLMSRRV